MVTWTSSGVAGNLDIILRQAGAPSAPPVMGIAAGTANDGTEGWTVPPTVAPGSYLVRIRSVSNPSVYYDSANFLIRSCGTPTRPEIIVTSPATGGTTSYVNGNNPVTWTSTNLPGARMKIQLFQGTNLVRNIAPDTENDGFFDWTVPDGLISPTPYYFRVSTVDNAVRGDSFPFTITWTHIGAMAFAPAGPPDPRITISSPLCHGTFRRGTRVFISYMLEGDLDPREQVENQVFYDITLPNGAFVGTMVRALGSPPNRGGSGSSAEVTVGLMLDGSGGVAPVPPGNYRIRVHFSYGGNLRPAREISDSCGEFTLTN